MQRRWTFGRKIAAAFAALVVITLISAGVAIVALSNVVTSKDHVINGNAQRLTDAQALRADDWEKVANARGFLLTTDQKYIDQLDTARTDFDARISALRRIVTTDEERRSVDAIEASAANHTKTIDSVMALRRTDAPIDTVTRAFEDQVVPKQADLATKIDGFVTSQEKLLADARQASTDTANTAMTMVIVLSLLAVAIAALLGYLLARSLRRQIGTAVGEVRTSSSELQATANQQASAAKEQSTTMNEINSTINELLATSRQIGESAQRVAQVADQTAGAGRSGQETVVRARESIDGIRRQVDVIVNHMLELGDKSQQIGAVLDIVSELAEQTNILAINSTIEAAGAGEAGKRFAVVADEIRKLADSVAGSTKEIRGLIDVVRGAVNTAVMATEIGSKGVDAGSAQFSEVANSFEEISELVTVTNEAAREIELSTKQQTTAVEQVNVAISDVAQATRETEASSLQTAQTATQLATLASDLQRLIEPAKIA